MKTLLLILLIISIISCAEEDSNRQAYNIDALSSEHRMLFRDAMEWWNDGDNNASFWENSNSNTKAVYGDLDSGIAAKITHLKNNNIITFSLSVSWYPIKFCGISRHELGHTFTSIHSLDPEDAMHSPAPFCIWDEV